MASDCGVTAREHPATLAGDAHRHHLELVGVERGRGCCRRSPPRWRVRCCARRRRRRCGSFAACSQSVTLPAAAEPARAEHQTWDRAAVMSATRSAGSSMPQESRTRPGRCIVAPLGPPVRRGVQPAEGRRRQRRVGTPGGTAPPLGRAEFEREHAGNPPHLPRRDHIGRIVGQAGPADRPYGRVREQRGRDRGGVLGLPGQTQVEGGQRSVRQPGVEVARNATGAVTPGAHRCERDRRRGRPRSRAACLSGRSAPWCRSPPPCRRPASSGCWPSGVAVVLSTATSAPAAWAASARAAMSHTSRPGLAGVSSSTSRTPSNDGYGPAVGARLTVMPRGVSA